MQHDAADELNVVMPQANGALAGFTHHGKGFGKDIVEGFARGQAAAKGVGLGAQGFIAEVFVIFFQRVDVFDQGEIFFEDFAGRVPGKGGNEFL